MDYEIEVVRKRTVYESTTVTVSSKKKLTEEEVFSQATKLAQEIHDGWDENDEDIEYDESEFSLLSGEVKPE